MRQIEDDDVGAHPRRIKLPQDPARLDADKVKIGLVADRRIDRQQVVVAEGLHRVPGVVEKSDRLWPGLAQGAAEIGDPPLHRVLVDIEKLGHLEPDGLQRIGHQRRVVHRVVEPADRGVPAVPDHQRDAPLTVGAGAGPVRKHKFGPRTGHRKSKKENQYGKKSRHRPGPVLRWVRQYAPNEPRGNRPVRKFRDMCLPGGLHGPQLSVRQGLFGNETGRG